MSDNLIPSSAAGLDNDQPTGPGATLRLASLAPKFDAIQHQLYLDLLERALAHDDSRNIAITGAYGTGKSSVLSSLRNQARYKDSIVWLSLSTIASRDHSSSDTDDPSDSPTSRVNQIQKEIVKQLLYRTAVSAVPQSRFRRATVPDRRRELGAAVIIGLVLAAVLFALGPLHPVITSWFSDTWRHWLAYGVVTVLLVAAAWGATVVLRARPVMSASVNAAITTVTLTKQSDTYFDAYLDEIVYFFEATKCNVVVIEDIDRFEDAEIFDTLRALNGLLNGSRQIGRRITFVYAIRDSVFERIGATPGDDEEDALTPDRAKEALKRASRTKFFDVIIPVVPFVSPDNARDVMSASMKSKDFKISPALIRLAARHVADMRMIHNIRNEFEIYRNQLVVSKQALPDITDDLVFAIVLFKNTHLADYENIRHRESSLDRLYRAWRSMVAASTPESVRLLTAHRDRRGRALDEDAQAARLRESLLNLVADLDAAIPSPFAVDLPADVKDRLASATGWTEIVENDELSLPFTRNSGAVTSFTFSAESLTRLLGSSVDPADWAREDLDIAEATERRLAERVRFLRHHTWAELHAREDVSVDPALLDLEPEERARLNSITDQDEVTFADLSQAILPSKLARDLVRQGFITSHFALYTSHYYGKHLSKQAREYIYRFIGPGIPDATFELRPREVRQILREQDAERRDDADLFSDPSILNVGIVDYLLVKRQRAVGLVARQLAKDDASRKEFLDVYMSQGEHPGALLAQLTSHWSDVVHYATTSSAIPTADRVDIVNSVLLAVEGQNFTVDPSFAAFLADNYSTMESVVAPADADHARAVFGLLRSAGGVIPDLHPLSADARDAALALQAFSVTAGNLRLFVPRGQVVLGRLRQTNRALYDHVLANVDAYVSLVHQHAADFATVTDGKQLARLATDLSGSGADVLRQVFESAPGDVLVAHIKDLPVRAWQTAVGTRRVAVTFANVAAYVEQHGVDDSLAILLKGRHITTEKDSDLTARRDLAYVLLGAADSIPSTLARAKTAASLAPGTLDPDLVTPESGDLVARLIAVRLLPDNETTFTSALMLDWTTLERTIKASKAFKTFASPAVVPVGWVPDLVRSPLVSHDQRLAVIDKLESYLPAASRAQARDIAAALIQKGWRIHAKRIQALLDAGAFQTQVVALLAKEDRATREQTRAIFRSMGGKYERVALGGKGRPSFPADDAHLTLLERFAGDTVRRVSRKQFKNKGQQLVAHLQ